MKGFLTDWILHRLFEWSIDNRYIGQWVAPIRPLLTLQCPQFGVEQRCENIGTILVFPDYFFFFLFFIAIKAIIIRDSGFRVFPRSNPGTVGFYRSHVQHDRDIIYQLLIFTLVSSRIYIIIFSTLILRILVVQQCVQRESKMYLLQKIIPFIQRNHRLV